MLISLKVARIVVLTNLKKCVHILWIHTFLKGYILGPKMVGAWQGSTPSGDIWGFFQQIHPFKSNTPILFYFINRKQKNPTY